ncbi:hypothetical protein HPP92_009472 [Vanilla planifolia]|uniref:Uncharacterized protein n=1 Tax=Vanilla planifolia TaxID=51239 RepID=A0A835V5G6_VANPL|nr:hypothetical protein HPP92_009472 [Vanilla planifolia]
MKIIQSPPLNVQPAEETAKGSNYFLSNLDHFTPCTIKILQCYASTDRRSTEDVAHVLRASLKKVLADYSPWTGRLADGGEGTLFVLMDGSGVPFVEAVADVELEQLGVNSILHGEMARDFVYCPPARSALEVPLLSVQITKMKCGGFVLGLALSHFIADGMSMALFLHAWAEATRGLPLSVNPFLDRTLLLARCPPLVEYPHREFIDLAVRASAQGALNSSEPFLQRYFAFDASKLARLKRLAYDGDGPPPSTFSALAGLVWRSWTKALNKPWTDQVMLLFAVNVRNRLKPPLPVGFFGNAVVPGCSIAMAGELINRPLSYAVEMVQHAARLVTDEFVRSVIDDYELTRSRLSLAGTLLITDWTHLGFGDTDFGWGCPKMGTPAELFNGDMALFSSTSKNNKDIFVIVALPESAMSSFMEIMEF